MSNVIQERPFSISQHPFWPAFARILAAGKPIPEHFPYSNFVRSEVFLIVGLLYESQGKTGEVRLFLEKAHKEDPTLAWPAYLAGRRMQT